MCAFLPLLGKPGACSVRLLRLAFPRPRTPCLEVSLRTVYRALHTIAPWTPVPYNAFSWLHVVLV